jgi:hypothetical protein
LGTRSRTGGKWRQRASASAFVAACYSLPIIWPQVAYLSWHWFWSVAMDYGELLSLMPAAAMFALVAPAVGYRRRDAWVMLFPPRGIRLAWTIGNRLAQLPNRTWPESAESVSVLLLSRCVISVRRHLHQSICRRRNTVSLTNGDLSAEVNVAPRKVE